MRVNKLECLLIVIFSIFCFSDKTVLSQSLPTIPKPPKPDYPTSIQGPSNIKVNLINGGLSYCRNLVNIPGLYTGLSIKLKYDSKRFDRDSCVGFAWNWNYEATYYEELEDDIIVHFGEKDILFEWDPINSQFNPPHLKEYEPGKYKLSNQSDKNTYYFDDSTHKCVTSSRDDFGNTIKLEYIGKCLTKVIDASDRYLDLEYTNGHLSKITDSNNDPIIRTLSFEYDDDFNLIEITDFSGYHTYFEYNDDHFLTSIKDPINNKTEITYEDLPPGTFQPVKIISCIDIHNTLLSRRTFEYLSNDRTTNVIDTWGDRFQTTIYHYNENRNITQITDPSNFTRKCHYEQNEIIQTDQNENSTRYILDDRGRVTGVENAAGDIKYYEYDSSGNIVFYQDYCGNIWEYEYNNLKQLKKIIEPKTQYGSGETKFIYYLDTGKLKAKIDALDNITRYEYDEYGYPMIVTGPMGHSTTFDYDNVGNQILVIDANSNKKEYIYDLNDRLITEIISSTNCVDLLQTTYQYDGNGNLTQETDPYNNFTKSTYDGLSRVIRVEDGLGVRASNEYDMVGNKFRKFDANGYRTTFIFDECNRIVEKRDHLENTMYYEYDPVGNATFITNARGHTIERCYNELNLIVKEIFPTPSRPEREYTYDSNGNITKVVNENEKESNYKYDSHNLLIFEKDAEGGETNYTYDLTGNWETTTDPLGNTVKYKYNKGGWRRLIIDPRKKQHVLNRDNVGNIIQTVDPNQNVDEYEFDFSYRLIFHRDTLGNTTQYCYSNSLTTQNKTIVVIDANDGNTTFEYGTRGRIIRVTDALGYATKYDYDGNGNLIELIDAHDKIQAVYEYNHFNKVEKETDAYGFTTTYQYDEVGNLIQRTDANGIETIYEYDELNRLIEINYPNKETIYIYYDDVGNITKMSQGNVNEFYKYDGCNRVILSRVKIDSIEKSIKYWYNRAGDRTYMMDPDGRTVNYSYNTTRYLTRISDFNTSTDMFGFAYDAGNRINKKLNYNGTYTDYQYNLANRLINIKHYNSADDVILNHSYLYDESGNRIWLSDDKGNTIDYKYDSANQIIQVTKPDNRVDYVYDEVGNRIEKTVDQTSTKHYRYDDSNRLRYSGKVEYTWDNNGNNTGIIKSDVQRALYYDEEDRLISIKYDNGSKKKYGYFPSGKLLYIENEFGIRRYFIYDGYNVLIETDQSGETVKKYMSFGVDNWLSVQEESNRYIFHKDILMSVLALSDENQEVKVEYTYDEFGVLEHQRGDFQNDLMFTGRRYDEYSQDYYYRSRTYNPKIGRFLQKDPLRIMQKENLYLYVENNPVNFIDPHGLCGNVPYLTSGPLEKPWPPGGTVAISDPTEIPGGGNGPGTGVVVQVDPHPPRFVLSDPVDNKEARRFGNLDFYGNSNHIKY